MKPYQERFIISVLIIVFLTPTMLISQKCNGQKIGDTKIIVIAKDTTRLYERLKDIFIRENFIVKDLSIRDSLFTYPSEKDGIYIAVIVAFNKDTVTLSGSYGLKRIDSWGFNHVPKGYEDILYYKGSKGWKFLKKIASQIGDRFIYKR